MKKLSKLMALCEGNNFNCSLTYQRSTDFSIEIYTGYCNTYAKLFYTDGHINPNNAIKEGLKFMRKLRRNGMSSCQTINHTLKTYKP